MTHAEHDRVWVGATRQQHKGAWLFLQRCCSPACCHLQAPQTKVVVEYTLTATPEVQVEVLAKAEASVYLFIRVQQPAIPWWSGAWPAR